MALTGEFSETVRARAECDPGFRVGLLGEAVEALLSNDVETGKVLLGHYADATVGIESLAPTTCLRRLPS